MTPVIQRICQGQDGRTILQRNPEQTYDAEMGPPQQMVSQNPIGDQEEIYDGDQFSQQDNDEDDEEDDHRIHDEMAMDDWEDEEAD